MVKVLFYEAGAQRLGSGMLFGGDIEKQYYDEDLSRPRVSK